MVNSSPSQALNDLLITRNFNPESLDSATGKPPVDAAGAPDPDSADMFTFDYVAQSGKNYGTVVILLSSDNGMTVFYGDNLGRGMDTEDKTEWYQFLQQLKSFAVRNSKIRGGFKLDNINRLKYTMAGMAAIKEGLFESYYGSKKISYAGEPTQARLMIKHSRNLEENDARFRYVESLFIETADGERFKLPFKKLSGGRAMLEHVKQGGNPYDIRGQHISQIVEQLNVLAQFRRANQNKVFEGDAGDLVTETNTYYTNLQRNLKTLSSSQGYSDYFESWTPADILQSELVVEDLKNLFVETRIDPRIEQALPMLARIQQEAHIMKEAEIFENWANQIVEGSWALPDNPEAQSKLNELMSKELIVGPDATNAKEQLYDVVGDDQLFDILNDLAAQDPRANVWDDTDVQARLQQLGIQMNTTAAADQQQPVAPAAGQQAPGTAPEQAVAEGAELDAMLKHAGVPVKESVLTDSTGHTLDHILKRFSREVEDFKQNGELDTDLYDALYDYYFDDMPYGTKKARTGDPYEWISQRLYDELGMNESNSDIIVPEADVLATFETMPDLSTPVQEGSCNMTAEGEYCPEHGLAECGYMESMGGTVAGAVAPVMEDQDDLLARIKALALIK